MLMPVWSIKAKNLQKNQKIVMHEKPHKHIKDIRCLGTNYLYLVRSVKELDNEKISIILEHNEGNIASFNLDECKGTHIKEIHQDSPIQVISE